MEEKLPKVFANKIENVQNNRKYYYSERDNVILDKNEHEKRIVEKYNLNNVVKDADIHQKIIKLFKSPNNVYKVKADIKINGQIITKNLIGRTNSTLITLDDEIINIADIEDIDLSKK